MSAVLKTNTSYTIEKENLHNIQLSKIPQNKLRMPVFFFLSLPLARLFKTSCPYFMG